ncbi:bifunctional 4-hydroxy-2-oxoglutarate aldolase/2-dehydro-3-deoxy-phosphogluconate aldolase [Actinomadura montaniterrae]|uniref:2-dehydro-3-deoxy-phosphogluconate aldolase n=1 Tax=Actinomadura montaniterrae TaxID=1803903 RepID=A0A6L3VL87_9ACTN|nr:bifunctional 4-hydroxy-2-oxoglutarate aldolase/2-dehydro-3-deoxy-phosphogluconate aldolase [Actinomadura montaniterrae]KAB2370358.1 bifunctional 4-hydroxy-2-oxoglutarate aldolase/2-dehydro-3-deoxy-phosphogluconate aldolase [Actinomadura montaniterrae]
MNTEELFGLAPVVPVVVLDDADHAVPLARALVDGGLPAIEVTLRTPAAVESIERIAAEVPDAVVGAGTVVTAGDAERSLKAGARFLVSPGCTPRLRAAMADTGLPFLPGVSSASEAMALLEEGVTAMKFFPAEPAGGVPYLKALGGPLPQITFCPTGGIRPGNAADYLALPNVGCVGGTWLTPSDAVRAGDWDRVRALAAEAAELRPA